MEGLAPEREVGVAKSDPADRAWWRSTASESGACVEVAFGEQSVLVRHSASPTGPILAFTPAEWAAFLTGVRNGEFDAGRSQASGLDEPATS